MMIAMIGVSGTGKSTLARFISEQYGYPINPVGSRSVAKEMGFVGPDGEGRPYDVDRADLGVYRHALDPNPFRARMNPPPPRLSPVDAADSAMRAWKGLAADGRTPASPSCRPLFQQRLAEAKIAWESQTSLYTNDSNPKPADGFVTDRTPLDDMMYAMMHCPSIVDQKFRERAYRHTETYDVIYYLPLRAGQWLANDPNRVTDLLYHWRGDVILQGLMSDCNANIVEIEESERDDRQAHVRASIDAIIARARR